MREFCGIDKDSIVDLSCSQLWGQVKPVSEFVCYVDLWEMKFLCGDKLMQC